ncbi:MULTISPECIES: aminotransferase class I/II-fold pyridoxal phosphate-dependent enzyme [unclassified Pseudomonas]|uniref:aminotransferase class I/II-fold pyridoxal phosphate-dependent enzyme n=1 Tax=unclassified Pseudomonas TaxID=196821 RepID=UPI0018E6C570|nr:aminotransferase class I/II-fold pyridoxal phosphate-dependent enzyme [Pseudomonas sp. CCOS 191]MBI6954538.1 aminotransferase class I/II-fold pyridoxal phosphate-dependent enzyme [Pseudomonas sp. CCOS 191]
MNNGLSQRSARISAPGTSSMRSKANALRDAGIKVINFAAGELSSDAAPDMRHGAIAAVHEQWNRYTPPLGNPRLRQALASSVSQRLGVDYRADEIAVSSGAKQALFNSAMVLFDPGDEVIIPRPYWETFPTQVELAGACPVFVDTKGDNHSLRGAAVKAAVSPRSKAIIINTPNNPTGVVYAPRELIAIGELALEHKLWVIFDECYRSLLRNGQQHHNLVALLPELKASTIIIDSFSKSQAVTGWRLGYACAPKAVVAAMHNLQAHTTSNPSSLAQYAALNALDGDGARQFGAEVNAQLDRQLAIATALLGKLETIRFSPPQGAFYLYLDITRLLGKRYQGEAIRDASHLCELLLTEARIALVPGCSNGDPCAVRLSYSVSPQDLEEGLGRFTDFIATLA